MKKVSSIMFLTVMLLVSGSLSANAFAAAPAQKVTCKVVYNSWYEPSLYTEAVILHYGVNGWNEIKDVPMTCKYGYDENHNFKVWYEADVEVNENDTIDYCFHILYNRGGAEGFWENNDGNDFHMVAK